MVTHHLRSSLRLDKTFHAEKGEPMQPAIILACSSRPGGQSQKNMHKKKLQGLCGRYIGIVYIYIYTYLEPQRTSKNRFLMDGNGETAFFHVKIWNHHIDFQPFDSTWMFRVPMFQVEPHCFDWEG